MDDVTRVENIKVAARARRPLRILLSAYACEPNRGSEPGIGWQWATRLAAAGHEVCVITRANNAAAIAAAMRSLSLPTLSFAYFDLPPWARFWKRKGHGAHLYYFLWQFLSFPIARRLHRRRQFDVIHHLTFGVFRQASPLAWLDAPFVFGPVGGGERAPKSLRRGLSSVARGKEILRDLANFYARIDPLLRLALRHSAAILCKTEETRASLPRRVRKQSALFFEVGADGCSPPPIAENREATLPATALRVLFVGRLVYLKGVHLALPAFARLLRRYPDSRFTIVGSGPEESDLRTLALRLGIDRHVDWVSWLPQKAVMTLYPQHDVMLFPSLHDSSGNAVLEAMAHGVPVVCLKLGGPAAIVDEFSGIRIGAVEPNDAVEQLGEALTLLARTPQFRAFLARGAYARANCYFSWRAQVERMTALYHTLLDAAPRSVS